MTETSKAISSLSPEKRALLARKLKEQGARFNTFPLSFGQQRLWFSIQLQPDTLAYNITSVVRLSGALDVTALERALAEIIRRHESLRTTFPAVDGKPVQVIAPAGPIRLPIADLADLPEAEREAEVRRRAGVEARTPFDLAQGPLLRVTLLRTGAREHAAVMAMHHIISDAWSSGILIREMAVLYDAFLNGRPSPLPELPIQYADFAAWQREWLQGEVLAEQINYWKKQLAGAPALLELPTDRPRPPVQSPQAGVELLALDAELTGELKSLSRQAGATLYMTMLGLFATLLARYSAEDDVVIGTSVANRNRKEMESLIGFIANTVVMRADLAGNPTFRQLLERMRQMVLGALAHQDMPFERLVEELQPPRNPAYNPLFQVFFLLQNAPATQQELSGLTLSTIEMDGAAAMFDLMLLMKETVEGGLRGSLHYNRVLFDPATIQRFGERFRLLAEQAVRQPDTPLDELWAGMPALQLPRLPVIAPAGRDAEMQERQAPLSSHQERLWFIDQFETGNVYASHPIYHNIPLLLAIEGSPVDAGLLEQSLNEVIARHEPLRTRILSEGDRQFQSVRAEARLTLDVTPLAAGTTADAAVERALDEARRPFRLDRAPLLRAVLFQQPDGDSLLLLVAHHIIADRQSLQLIAGELAERYAGRMPALLPALPLQYADYTVWQRELPAETRESLLLYWRRQLRGKLAALELPEQRRRPAVHTFTDGRRGFTLDARLRDRIQALSRQHQVSECAVLLAGFQAVLHRYTGQEEIVLGMSDACRTDELASAVGPFANLLVLRGDLGGAPAFRELAARAHRTLEDARAHRAMPFDRLVLELKPEKDMSRTALFDVLFQFEAEPLPELSLGQARARIVETNLGYGKYDLHLLLRAEGDGLAGTVVYNTDIYDEFMIEQLMRHYETLLAAVCADSSVTAADVQLLGASEQQQQLAAWNASEAAWPADRALHRIFEMQAIRFPDRTAVQYEGARLSYRELDEEANRLAHELIAQGVKPGMLVALCLDRSVEMIVALLGVLKAGGAYLPMDPEYPRERIGFMIEDSGVSHLITTTARLDCVPPQAAALIQPLLLDAHRERIAARPAANPAVAVAPDQVAYCIYTSGSTGKPKGVLVEHRNVVRLLVNDKFQFQINEDDVWTMFHSYCFDFSVWEMYGALLYGGKLVIVPSDVTRDPALFLDLLLAERVTFLNQTPSAFYNLAREALARAGADLALRYVVFGGEALTPIQLREWHRTWPAVRLINMYGITETTVHVTFKEITAHEIEANRSNIGVPIPTTTTYILDSRLRLLPVGVPGEICVGGDGVSRGYLNRDELTRQRFVPNPFRLHDRLYRSGDVARLLPTGEMEYLGRSDNQVQVRGFRVELGEIQSHLLRHPAVSEAVVIARQTQTDDTQIVAYLVATAETSVTALRNHLLETLPHYMAPSAFVMLDALPLTRNGKVDLKALPAPEGARPELEGNYVAPRTSAEETLAGIWAEVLGLDRVGIHDSFFDLGGHSLLATQVISRVRDAFAVELQLRYIFEAPTIAGLTERIEEMQAAGDAQARLPESNAPIEVAERNGHIPLSFAQQRLWFIDQVEPGNASYNMPGGVRLKGALDVAALEASLNEIVRRHESLRTRFDAVDGQPVQLIAPELRLALPVTDLRAQPDAEAQVRRLAAEEAATPFDLSRGPLFRVRLLQLPPASPGEADEHVLLFSMHHIISDEWSFGVLVRELAALYEAFQQGRPSPLAELPIQYPDFAHWQRRRLQGETLDVLLDYWRGQLGDGIPTLELPFDHPRPAAPTYRGALHPFTLPAEASAALKALSRQEGVTMFMTLLAALQTLLHRSTGQEDIVVGTDVANRNRVETEGLIGFFINHLVLRTKLGGNPGFRQLLRRVRDVTLGAYAHQDLPFDKLVSALRLERTTTSAPLFQVLFVFGNPSMPVFELPGLSLRPLRADLVLAKYDLTLFMNERESEISGAWRYGVERFEAATIGRMSGHFETLLGQIAANPDARLKSLELLTEAEKQQEAERQEARGRRLRNVNRKAVDLKSEK
jgi:amino acid adenylation domain-containing protein